ncbi:hypothetical protein DCAR_0934961 [Daucus carota subsp. sativus]|uniref:Uncharacterized protein n=1 Tax=Daucus carota subsp. sativus TaxID=79200 RepID=A0A175YGD4_DAUCS|nr:hypothetical protein DCAR_0934961 [Daucus carota subsp. sativus]
MVLYMVSERGLAGGLGFEPLPPPIFSQFKMDTKAIYVPKMGARDPLFNPKMGFRVRGSVEYKV